MIAERNSLRRERRYDEADAVRDQLNGMGVQIWDTDRLWSLEGTPPPDRDNTYFQARERSTANNFYRNAQRAGSRGGRYEEEDPYARDERPRTKSRVRDLNEFGHDYSRSEDCEGSLRVESASFEAINTLLRERLEAKLARDYDEADALLAQLYDQYGVTVNDGAKRWRADGKSFERKFTRAGPADPNVDEAAVMSLVNERHAVRKERNYRRADEILAELLEVHGVVVVDSTYTWRIVGEGHDGAYGEGGGYGRRQATNDASSGWHDYMREPGDDAAIPADQLEAINDLLARRLALKKTRKFEEADALQAELIDELGVGVDDRSRTWWVENVAD